MTDTFEALETTLKSKGPEQAVDRLCELLRERKDYHGLFYALLLRKRLDLGLPAVQAGGSDDMPKEMHEPYENAIRDAARTAGDLYLDGGDISSAWPFFRMISEPAKVAEAIDRADPEDGELAQRIIEIALHEGANPRRGFDLVLKRYGICSAITTFGQCVNFPPDIREHCTKRLVQALYEELRERLLADIQRRESEASPEPGPQGTGLRPTVRELIAGRDWLFEDEFYHIDVSHLGSIVQFSVHLPPCAELQQAIELCEYGMKLSPKFQYAADPPFDNSYRDYHVYLRTLAGEDVETGIAHFRARAENADPEDAGTLPAEVLVNLLVKLKRYREAVDVFTRYLAKADARQLSCPSLQELCQRAGDYRSLVEVSRQRDDLVNFTAGLLQGRK